MPKIVETPKSRTQIQADSDNKRGVKVASYKFPIEFLEHLTVLSNSSGLSRSQLIMQAVELWEQHQKKSTS